MSNRENEGKSGFTLVTLALAALAVCAIALLLMPAHATTEVSEQAVATYASANEVGYLPAQVENHAKEPVQTVDMTY
jgi:predicted Abi (CAAX) family protease